MTGAVTGNATDSNILLVLTDNTGWGDYGAYGGGEVRGAPSPNVDQMAEEGLLLQNFNTEPQCTPSPSALNRSTASISRILFWARAKHPDGRASPSSWATISMP